jgi:hypothetical protein
MRSILSALSVILVLACGRSIFSQTITEADEKAARGAADSLLTLVAESLSRDSQMARLWGLSSPIKLSRLNANHLGDACKFYVIDLNQIQELNAICKSPSIHDVISISELMFLLFPIVVDDSTILDINVRRVPDPEG